MYFEVRGWMQIYVLQKSVVMDLDKVFCTISDYTVFLAFLSHISLAILSLTTASSQSCGSNVDTKELCGE